LIGRGGSNVKGLQEDFNVKINIPRKEDNSSQITVTGSQESDILACKDEIEHQLGYDIGEQEFGQLILDIPKNKHGIILGSGGSNIRDLEQKTGCNIIIPGRDEKTSNVTLEGTSTKLEHLKELIEDLVGDIKVVSSTHEITHLKSTSLVKDSGSGDINEALFFPHEKSEVNSYEIFLEYLSSPKKTIDVCVFTITDDSAANILIDLHKKGIKVRVITDDDQSASNGSDIQTIKKSGIPVKMDSSPYHMHNKYAIIDGQVLLNGSYNWTTTANTKNNENIIITNNKKLVSSFSNYFEQLWKQFK